MFNIRFVVADTILILWENFRLSYCCQTSVSYIRSVSSRVLFIHHNRAFVANNEPLDRTRHPGAYIKRKSVLALHAKRAMYLGKP